MYQRIVADGISLKFKSRYLIKNVWDLLGLTFATHKFGQFYTFGPRFVSKEIIDKQVLSTTKDKREPS